MTFEELFDKYLQEDSFKKEVKELLENNDLKEAISRYGLPYSEKELATLISDKAESANCKDTKRIAELQQRIDQINDRIKELNKQYDIYNERARAYPAGSPVKTSIIGYMASIMSDINKLEKEKRALEEELARIS